MSQDSYEIVMRSTGSVDVGGAQELFTSTLSSTHGTWLTHMKRTVCRGWFDVVGGWTFNVVRVWVFDVVGEWSFDGVGDWTFDAIGRWTFNVVDGWVFDVVCGWVFDVVCGGARVWNKDNQKNNMREFTGGHRPLGNRNTGFRNEDGSNLAARRGGGDSCGEEESEFGLKLG
ncbi:uncharacterized protein LACBIDRAFT_335894 [Laccaria bicolor S238N-H82]|uniref:Predicted protein n=1 Tax=Laccaria bicolor (strain S238N-H82 / ATCC MYA-4686) TaxID=486041 RepID=B0E3R9_LACBS|nr:uncharacterized protein LACBIDRAFT_335894 [Laccaria bicolor S238N-H82]EDQ98514.1 predicted protein [Laccaria bicolor S238N-H82]|eukprot:XP_001890837.1 predicted protein [Laccaria bicolor S238N-H82]